jgi:hypothetical protein
MVVAFFSSSAWFSLATQCLKVELPESMSCLHRVFDNNVRKNCVWERNYWKGVVKGGRDLGVEFRERWQFLRLRKLMLRHHCWSAYKRLHLARHLVPSLFSF